MELELLEELEDAAEATLDVEEVSVDVEQEGEACVVLEVTGIATVEAEKTEV